MYRGVRHLAAGIAALVAGFAGLSAGTAAAVADFYKGKTVTIIVAAGPAA